MRKLLKWANGKDRSKVQKPLADDVPIVQEIMT